MTKRTSGGRNREVRAQSVALLERIDTALDTGHRIEAARLLLAAERLAAAVKHRGLRRELDEALVLRHSRYRATKEAPRRVTRGSVPAAPAKSKPAKSKPAKTIPKPKVIVKRVPYVPMAPASADTPRRVEVSAGQRKVCYRCGGFYAKTPEVTRNSFCPGCTTAEPTRHSVRTVSGGLPGLGKRR